MKATYLAHGTGRRKTAVARVYLRSGNAKVTVNNRTLEDYFPFEIYRLEALRPLVITGQESKFDIKITVRGSGVAAQAGAVRHGISRALLALNEEIRPLLKEHGFLTRDSRVVERKKYGQKKARKRFQFSKR